jgi:FkbM family methyltransferase
MSTKIRYLYRALRYRLHVDPAELRFIASHLHSGQLAVDVGCHKGAYAYWMRRRVGGSGEVIAFEPQPRQVDYLRRAFTSMNYRNVTLFPMGLSDRPGRLNLYIPLAKGATHEASFVTRATCDRESRAVEVDVTTLDAVFANRPRAPHFIKIDVEGHELAVLHGGAETLKRHRPILLIECEARHRPSGDVKPVFDFLQSLGFTGSFFHGGGRRPMTEFQPARHQPQIAQGASPPAGYVCNFAFVHHSRS